MSGSGQAWEERLAAWAAAEPGLEALVQIGSRVQPGATVDAWSDYDYQLVTRRPGRYRDGAFAREIAPCWACGAHVAFGNAVKVTAVYEGALEADFVILGALDLKVAFAAMRWPAAAPAWPRVLERGIRELRIVAGRGWRVIHGGGAWERRYARIEPLEIVLDLEAFTELSHNFWAQAVWASKKLARGEYLAAQRGFHEHLQEAVLRVLQEQARIEGRRSYPLGRRAETWLGAGTLAALGGGTRPEAPELAAAILQAAGVFESSAAAVAAARGWPWAVDPQLRAWLGNLLVRQTGTAPR